MAKLVYFALSIFWRGTRHWSAVEGGQPPKLYLGRQEKAIRAFLLARGKLPEDVVVTVAVWPYKKVYPMAMMPRADAGTGYRSYWFYFFGFIFLLALGRKIPAQQRRTCSYHSPEKFLALSLGLGSLVHQHRAPLAGSFEDRKHVQGNSGDPFQGAIQGTDKVDITFIIMYIKAVCDHYCGH